jgi:predicted O-methyltransferase YrrM
METATQFDLSHALAIQGWMEPDELRYLAHLSYSAPPGSNLVEIGSFKGRSACALGLNPEINLYCVDIWPYIENDGQWWYDIFRHNTAHLSNVHPVVRPSRYAAMEFAQQGMRFSVIFIDAEHTRYNVISDINAWRPLLAEGGILSGHDYEFTGWPDVAPVVREMVPNHRKVPGTLIWTTEGC